MKFFFSILIALMGTLGHSAELRVALPDRDDLVIDVPDDWKARINRPRPDLPPTVVFVSSDPRAFQVLMTPIWSINGRAVPTKTDNQSLVQRAIQSAQTKAVESSIPMLEFQAPGKSGHYFQATDREPEPDGYKYLTQGALLFDELRITFTVLANEPGRSASGIALDMLRGLRRGKGKGAI